MKKLFNRKPKIPQTQAIAITSKTEVGENYNPSVQELEQQLTQQQQPQTETVPIKFETGKEPQVQPQQPQPIQQPVQQQVQVQPQQPQQQQQPQQEQQPQIQQQPQQQPYAYIKQIQLLEQGVFHYVIETNYPLVIGYCQLNQ